MKDKLYKLKEEVKKYFTQEFNDKGRELEHWEIAGFTLEALEEVKPESIEVKINEGRGKHLYKKGGGFWTEQERSDIERLLQLGGFDYIGDLAYQWSELDTNKHFNDWMKEQGF